MTFALYYINPRTLSIDIKFFYKNYETAIKSLKTDVESFLKNNKNLEKIEYINKKNELLKKPDGYYLKMSNKYPNRINIYEKISKDVGIIFSNITFDIKKIYIFSIIELKINENSSYSNVIDDVDMSSERLSKPILKKKQNIIIIPFLDELKSRIKERYERLK